MSKTDLVPMVLKMYHEDYYTLTEIADYFGLSKQYIHQICVDEGHYFPKLPSHGFKNPSCREKEKLLALVKENIGAENVGRIIEVPGFAVRRWMKIHGIPATEFKAKSGVNSPEWRGGYFTAATGVLKGYVFVNCDLIGYRKINPTFRARYVLVHKAVIEDQLLNGHVMPPSYIIHHIDQDRSNNDLENLAILTRGEHMTIHSLLDQATGDLPKVVYDVIKSRINWIVQKLHEANLTKIVHIDYIDRQQILDVTMHMKACQESPVNFFIDTDVIINVL